MRLGIDARFYGTPGKGLGRYVSELIEHLEKIDADNDYFVFLRRENFDLYQPRNPRFQKVLAEFPWYGWREQLLYPFFLRRFRLDLMHFAHFNVPLLYRRPFVVTVHDLILLSHPTPRASTLAPLLYRLKYLSYRLVIGSALRRSRRVITVSETSKKEIEKRFPFTRDRDIAVTHEACSPALTGSDAAPTGVVPPFVLYVGNAYPHKNLDRLIEAFGRFRRSGHDDWRLVLVGAPDYFYGRLRQEAEAKDWAANVVFYGAATDSQLASLYSQAAFYVFPSLCEGFGLPPLEAMCRDLPVAAAKASSLPEILGDAALWFDPNDAGAIATAMGRLADDADLRRDLIERGRQQAAKYDWRRCARLTLDVFKNALKNRST